MQCQWLDIFMVKTSLDGRLSSVQIQIHKYTYIYKYKYTGLAHPSCQRFVTFCAVSSSTHVILMSKTGLDGPLRSVHILTTLMKGWIEKTFIRKEHSRNAGCASDFTHEGFSMKNWIFHLFKLSCCYLRCRHMRGKMAVLHILGVTQRHHSAPHKWLIINGFGVKILALCSEFCVFSMVQVFIVAKPMAMHRRLRLRSPIEI